LAVLAFFDCGVHRPGGHVLGVEIVTLLSPVSCTLFVLTPIVLRPVRGNTGEQWENGDGEKKGVA